MTWTLYVTLTARNRAIEAMVALFALIWAVVVLSYALRGTMPLAWAGAAPAAQWHIPMVLLSASALHMAGTALTRETALPAVLRAMGMAGMVLTFGYLSWRGLGSSAAPTYAFIASCCAAGFLNAARDARYAREVARVQ